MKPSLEHLASLKMKITVKEFDQGGWFYHHTPAWDNFMQAYWLTTDDPSPDKQNRLQQWFDEHGIVAPEQFGQQINSVYFRSEYHKVAWLLKWS